MKKITFLLLIVCYNFLALAQIPKKAQVLINAYKEQNLKFEDNYIIFEDGTKMIFDDGKQKDFVEMLDNSDLEDMFGLKYDKSAVPEYLADAGRSRCDAFFKKMYGNSAQEVQKNLVKVEWFGQQISFTKINSANKQLEKVAKEIAEHPELKKYMAQSSSFYWRTVRGANRMSAHSYGIAIDINVASSNYWRWSYKSAQELDKIKYENRIPLLIVEIFEKYGFVWGGRWYHFDTMHFEYRPEIIDYYWEEMKF